MRYLSTCSGIEAASVAFRPLGWTPLAFSEIETFPRAVLKHHYPAVPLHGDFREIIGQPWTIDADMLCGGTPCQDFSIAGQRAGLAGLRGTLTMDFVRLADAIDDLRLAAGRDPAWVLFENVPGILSIHDGDGFSAFLGALVGADAPIEHSGSWPRAGVVAGPRRTAAWRVLDARHFGLAQRRERVFVLALGGAGGWACADALLPIGESLRRHPAPGREAREGVAGTLTGRSGNSSRQAGANGNLAFGGNNTSGPIDVATARTASHTASGRQDFESETFVVSHALRAEGFDASEDGMGRGTPLVPIAFNARQDPINGPVAGPVDTDAYTSAIAFALRGREGGAMPEISEGGVSALRAASGGSTRDYIAFSSKDHGADATDDASPTPRAGGHTDSHANAGVPPAVAGAMGVRRITPTEAERLQGFPDGYTDIPWRGRPNAPDGPRYRALGNSWATPCVAWIAQRVEAVTKDPA